MAHDMLAVGWDVVKGAQVAVQPQSSLILALRESITTRPFVFDRDSAIVRVNILPGAFGQPGHRHIRALQNTVAPGGILDLHPLPDPAILGYPEMAAGLAPQILKP